jgi:hypothetical protein
MAHVFIGLGVIFLRIDLRGKRYGEVLTGRGGDFIIIDNPLKSDEALSELSEKLLTTGSTTRS